MPAPDPFDKLEELFDDSGVAPPAYSPTRKEDVVPPRPMMRTPTRAEAIQMPSGRTPTRTEAAGDDVQPFKPTKRPPLALVCVCDDGLDDGEWLRIRQATFTIGRTEGDFQLPFDAGIAAKHAEVSMTHEAGKRVWHLTDLHSTGGTFVAVNERPLKHNTELWLGSRRYRFEMAANTALPALRDISDSAGQVFVLDPPGMDFGREVGPGKLTVGDPCLAKRHARFEVAGSGWRVVNHSARNGVYVRVERVRFGPTCKFQIGEQRFIVRVLS